MLDGNTGHPLYPAILRLASLVTLFSFMFYIAAQFDAAGQTFASTFGLSATASILVGGGVIVLYTLLGGFWAASVTDTVQGLLNDGHARLLINMKGVDRIDSTGLGELVASRYRVQKNDGRIALVIPKGKVYDIFVISKLITIFSIYEDELEAVGSF